MSRHCEHCAFWKGNENSSRAECSNENVMGTTAHNDTCKHFNAKAWLTSATVKIDDAGKIVTRPGGGLIWAGATTYISPSIDHQRIDIIDFPIDLCAAYGVIGADGIIRFHGTLLEGSHSIHVYDGAGNHFGIIPAPRKIDETVSTGNVCISRYTK